MPSLPPFAVPPNRFPFRALAARAGRASLGGDREFALAALMVARLSCDALREPTLGPEQRAARATAAKAWLGSLALPAKTRPALARALEATARDADAIASAIAELSKIADQWLDEASVAELRGVTAAPFVSSR